MDSKLTLGPVEIPFQVQSINIDSQQAVKLLSTTRASKNLVINSGKSTKRAVITMLFTSIEEINTYVKQICVLFKTSPIISVSNEMLVKSWGDIKQYWNEGDNTPGEEEKRKNNRNIWIPVALEQLSISTVPDLLNSLYLTLVIAKVDISLIDPFGIRYALKEPFGDEYDPRRAYWLKKWITKASSQNTFVFDPSNFGKLSMQLVDKDLISSKSSILESYDIFNTLSSIQSYTCSISNLFSYYNLNGKGDPAPQYMGSSSRSLSIDFLFNELQEYKGKTGYEVLCNLRDKADALIRSKNRNNRLVGLSIDSPLTSLLNVDFYKQDIIGELLTSSNFFVPVSSIEETSDTPAVKTVRIDLIESNHNFYEENEIILNSGGTDYDKLKEHYNRIVAYDAKYRNERKKGPVTDDDLIEANTTLWPIDSGSDTFKKSDTYGILNVDSLKAALLSFDFDSSKDLDKALNASKYLTGQAVAGAAQLSWYRRVRENINQVDFLLNGPGEDVPEFQAIMKVLDRYSNQMIANSADHQEEVVQIRNKLFLAFLGDFDGTLFGSLTPAGGSLVQQLYGSDLQFTKTFTDALFSIVVKRETPPTYGIPAYSEESIYTAFFKLITNYAKYAKLYENYVNTNTGTKISSNKKKSMYPDLLLPTYIELYGDEWTSFAPTYHTFGLVNTNPGKSNSTDAQSQLAVQEDSYVSPSCWFKNITFKNVETGLFSGLDKISQAVSDNDHKLKLSIPFDTKDIDKIETILDARKKNGPSYGKEDLTAIIKETFNKYSNMDPLGFRSDMDALRLAASQKKYYDTFLKEDTNNIVVLYTNTGSLTGKRYMTVGGLGAELYRIANEYNELVPSDKFGHLEDVDRYKSVGSEKEYDFIRSLDENTKRCLKSVLDQVPDDHESYSRLFPACKVYLLEKRGTDLIGDDSIFSINPIISLDITLDKEDADLAVINIADPMSLLQKDFFPYGNIQTVRGEKGQVASKAVLSNLQGSSGEGFMKRYKLAQGRAVMIKMGYDSNPENLKTVFTGRIAEISPGEQLVIVAQGWKAELINRQVAFANRNPKNWGAKDLVVQTIEAANPAGFGDFYPQRDTNFILRNLSNMDLQEIASKVLQVQEGTDGENGSRDFSNAKINSIRETLGLTSVDKQNIGLDTRLKNIWYPDSPEVNNIFGWRSISEVGLSYINDGWVVPLQPAWDVLKEASRHTWGAIVQVVPFDGQATIFFGQPDQPYYYTKGSSTLRSNYEAYKKNYINSITNIDKDIFERFKNSDFYEQKNIPYSKRIVDSWIESIKKYGRSYNGKVFDPLIDTTEIINKVVIPYFSEPVREVNPSYIFISRLLESIDGYFLLGGDRQSKILKVVADSPHPYNAYLELKESLLRQQTIPTIMHEYFGISPYDIYQVWPSINQDLDILLRQSSSSEDVAIVSARITEDVGNIGSLRSSLDSLLEIYLKSEDVGYEFISSPVLSEKDFIDITTKITYINTMFIKDIAENTQLGGKLKELLSNISSLLKSRNQKNFPENVRNNQRLIRNLVNFLDSSENRRFKSIKEFLEDPVEIQKFRVWIYFLTQFIKSDSTARMSADRHSVIVPELPPTMQVFRVTHYVDDSHNIINNSIVASTRDMWNTVVIEHPSKGSISKVSDKNTLMKSEKLFSGAKWEYWPKQEVTGVVGLQFHPGLTLANKKLRIFTEANVQTEELAAKVCINRLADGIKKMYRGTLLLMGKVIKPYDRIVMNDSYIDMQGVIEVESVIHHWSAETGWVTNIAPEAVADANPGTSILQTAALESIYRRTFEAIDFASDVATLVLIIGTLGAAAAPLAAGEAVASAAVKKGVMSTIDKSLVQKSKDLLVNSVKNIGKRAEIFNNKLAGEGISFFGKEAANGLPELKSSPYHYLLRIMKDLAGPVVGKYVRNEVIAGLANQAVQTGFKFHVVTSFIEDAQKAKQLPVIINPLIFNGLPLTAGLELDDPIWSIYFNGAFWSWRDLQAGAAAILEEFNLTNFDQFQKSTNK